MISVFIVDDHEIVRRGVSELLDNHADIRVVGGASTVADALARIPAVAPDIVLLDVRLPDGSGIDVCRELHSSMPSVRSLILTSFDDDEAIYAAVMAGASGYVLKEIVGSRLVENIRDVAAGRTLLDPAVTDRVVRRMREQTQSGLERLSDRERDVLKLIAEGLTNRQIGERLFVAEKTVKNYVSSILTKLDMQRRTQAAVYASQIQSANPEPPPRHR